jgi:hypothetical protein
MNKDGMGADGLPAGGAEYNLDAMVRVLELPSVVLGGQRYQGQWLSLPQHIRFAERFGKVDVQDPEQAADAFLVTCVDMLDAMALPGAEIAKLPFGIVWQVVMGFLTRMQETMPTAPQVHPQALEAALTEMGMGRTPSGGSGPSGSASSVASAVGGKPTVI